MTIRELISKKDFDYIEYRIVLPNRIFNTKKIDEKMFKNTAFFGAFKAINGEIISLDGDLYNPDEIILYSEEWQVPERGIESAATIVVNPEWLKNLRKQEKGGNNYEKETHGEKR